MKSVDVSVIVVNTNTCGFLRGCLTSLGRSTRRYRWEAIVVDNNSGDGSVEMLKAEFPDVLVIRNQENVGFIHANNQALPYAHGRFIYYLNPDTEVGDEVLESLVSFLDENQTVGVVGPLLLNTDGTVQQSYFSFPGFFSMFIEHTLSPKISQLLERPDRTLQKPTEVDVIRGASLMVRSDLVRAVGGMNEHLFLYSDETDLCYRIKRSGYSVVFLPFVKVVHHERKTISKQSNDFVMYHYYRSLIIFLRDNYSPMKAASLINLLRFSMVFKRIIHFMLGNFKKAKRFNSLYARLANDGLW